LAANTFAAGKRNEPMMKSFSLIAICLSAKFTLGQQAIVATGGNVSGSGGSVSYSIGQVAYTSSQDGFVNGGVQQPYEVLITSVDETFSADYQVNIYPNPTAHELVIQTKNAYASLTAEVFNQAGGSIESMKLRSDLTTISVMNWAAGAYVIRLKDERGKSAVYQVIKH
jgi:hypothetical protein